MLWGIYSAICELLVHRCEKCVEIKGDYVEKYQSCFISVTLKSWSGRKLLDPTVYAWWSMLGALLYLRWPQSRVAHSPNYVRVPVHKPIHNSTSKCSITPLIPTLVIGIGLALRVNLDNSTKLSCFEITGYRIKYSKVLWLLEFHIRRGRKV